MDKRNRKSAKPVSGRSSLLIWPVVIAVFGLAGILTGFFGKWLLSGVLLLLFLLTLTARLWAGTAGNQLTMTLTAPAASGDYTGIFPGQTMNFRMKLSNQKLLPLLWAELVQPLPADRCILTDNVRTVEEWEKPQLEAAGFSVEQVGITVLPAVRWYGKAEAELQIRGVHRGLWSTKGWAIRTGDGIGLCQVELPLPEQLSGVYAVYPALQKVRTAAFHQPYWNAETGSQGILEDVTLIRTTREYQPGDPVKTINWRLAARGLPLTINLYEEILPRSVHFVLDGESFSGPEKHPEELEDVLSILTSVLCALEEENLQCGLSLCRGSDSEPVTLSGAGQTDTEEMLWALAGYHPLPDIRTGDTNTVVRRKPEFDTEELLYAMENCGHSYYIAYSGETASEELLEQLEEVQTTLLLWNTENCSGQTHRFAMQSLQSLKGGGAG